MTNLTTTSLFLFFVDVLPLVYNALESEHAPVQERALQAVPDLCDTIDYAELQGVLFPRVAVGSLSIPSSNIIHSPFTNHEVSELNTDGGRLW